jgi:hypothetical protein
LMNSCLCWLNPERAAVVTLLAAESFFALVL